MRDGISIDCFVPREKFEYSEYRLPQELSSELEKVINGSFKTRNLGLEPDYFSLPMWNHFKYGIFLRAGGNGNKIIGGLLAFEYNVGTGKEFILYDKVFVLPEYRKNGFCKDLIDNARGVDMDITKLMYPQRAMEGYALLSAARTSEGSLSGMYSNFGNNQKAAVDNDFNNTKYHVHVFGVQHPATNAAIREYSNYWYDVAKYVGSLKPTMTKIGQEAVVEKLA